MVESSQRHNLARGFEKVLAHKALALEAVDVVAQKLRIVVEHLLEVRNNPALVDAVAMKASRELIVDAAARHFFERREEGFAGGLVVAAHGHLEQQVERRRMRKLGLRTEASVARIELADDRSRNFLNQSQRKTAARGKALVVLDGGHHAGGGFERLVAALAPHLRHGHQDAPHARPAVAIVARNVRAAKVGSAVGREKRGQRPSALPADGRHRGLVARIHVGPLVAIHFHGDKKPVDERRDLRVFVRFTIHDVAPVAPHRADVEQDGFVLGLGARKRSLAPRMPVDGLVARRAQIGRCCVFQLIAGDGGSGLRHG